MDVDHAARAVAMTRWPPSERRRRSDGWEPMRTAAAASARTSRATVASANDADAATASVPW